jgi:hypothetical protein
MTDKGTEKGSVSALTAGNKLLNLLQRISLSKNELGEQFGLVVVKVDMHISSRTP